MTLRRGNGRRRLVPGYMQIRGNLKLEKPGKRMPNSGRKTFNAIVRSNYFHWNTIIKRHLKSWQRRSRTGTQPRAGVRSRNFAAVVSSVVDIAECDRGGQFFLSGEQFWYFQGLPLNHGGTTHPYRNRHLRAIDQTRQLWHLPGTKNRTDIVTVTRSRRGCFLRVLSMGCARITKRKPPATQKGAPIRNLIKQEESVMQMRKDMRAAFVAIVYTDNRDWICISDCFPHIHQLFTLTSSTNF